MQSATNAAVGQIGAEFADRHVSQPLTLRNGQLPADTLKSLDRLITALHGDDLDEQLAADQELRRLKLRDIARAEAGATAPHSAEIDKSWWKRIELHHSRREP